MHRPSLSVLLLHLQPLNAISVIVRPLIPSLITAYNQTHLRFPLSFLPAHCTFIDNPQSPGLDPNSCAQLAQATCIRFTIDPRVDRNRWIWSEQPGCAYGYYLPREAGVPSTEDCHQILESIQSLCARDERFNAGSVNVRDLPHFADDGSATFDREGRWIMAPERLTR